MVEFEALPLGVVCSFKYYLQKRQTLLFWGSLFRVRRLPTLPYPVYGIT